jgi:RNA polymerase-binding transcription factor DksA
MMKNNFLKEIEEKLKKEKEEIEAQLKNLGGMSGANNTFPIEFPNFGGKEDENADEVSIFTDRLSLGVNLEKRLKEINDALSKIENGTYGICEKCGSKIDEKRLKAFPTARYCVKCK